MQVIPAIHCAYAELRVLKRLKPHPDNPNHHPAEQIEKLANAMAISGVRKCITISKRSGMIVRGHCRRLAMIKLGMHKGPVDYQDYANDTEELADLVADTAIAEQAILGLDSVANILSGLSSEGVSAAGFNPDEFNALMREFAAKESKPREKKTRTIRISLVPIAMKKEVDARLAVTLASYGIAFTSY